MTSSTRDIIPALLGGGGRSLRSRRSRGPRDWVFGPRGQHPPGPGLRPRVLPERRRADQQLLGPAAEHPPVSGDPDLHAFGLAEGDSSLTVEHGDANPTILGGGTGSVTADFGIYDSALGDLALQGAYVDDVIIARYNANLVFTVR